MAHGARTLPGVSRTLGALAIGIVVAQAISFVLFSGIALEGNLQMPARQIVDGHQGRGG
jgi:hypothetical protein